MKRGAPEVPAGRARAASRRLAVVIILWGVTAAVFWPVIGHEFINIDDGAYLEENPFVSRGLTWTGIGQAFTSMYAANWHPLTWMSHMTDVTLFGLNPAGHHAVNLAIHALNVMLVFLILAGLTGSPAAAAVAAGLFGVHPLHVEAVAWVAERKEVLSALLSLLTIGAYRRFLERRTAGRYLLLVASFALALTAKPMPVTLPFALLLLDWWPLGRLGPGGEAPRARLIPLAVEKFPLLLLSAGSAVVTVLAQARGGAAPSLYFVPLWLRAANAVRSYGIYVMKSIWPARLAVYYPHPGSAISLAQVFLAAVALAAVTVLVMRARRQAPFLLTGWFWFLGTLVPVIGLVQVGGQALADRYTYLTCTGLFIMAVWGWARLGVRARIPEAVSGAAAVLVIAAMAVAAGVQVGYWRTSETLLRHTLAVTTRNAPAWNNLASLLAERGEHREAEDAVRTALAIFPQYDLAHLNLATLLAREGKSVEALEHYRAAARYGPDNFKAHLSLGVILARIGEYGEAIPHYRQALRLKPEDPEVLNNLGVALAVEGHYGEALGSFEQAVRRRPDYAEAHFNWGAVLDEMGDRSAAEAHWREALRLNPSLGTAGEAAGVNLPGDTPESR